MKRGGPLKRTEFKRKASPRAKRSRTERQRLEECADDLFRELIRWPGVCAATDQGDCWGELQCAHIFSRRYHATRWDQGNAVLLCEGHHGWFEDRPVAWSLWIKARIGAEVYEDLQRRRHGPAPAVWELEEVIKGLEELLEQLSPVDTGGRR